MTITQQTKIRESLQEMALLGLGRHGFFEKAAFYGGTALRILYGLDRFSEDLDFTLLRPDEQFDFAPYLKGMQNELASFGFEVEIEQKQKNVTTSVISAFMKMNTIKYFLAVQDEKKAKSVNHNEKIQIKVEIDTDPPPYYRVENRLVLNPVSHYVLTLNKSDLFAGKMQAVLYRAWKGRVKGRDWYDLAWYVQNKVPLNLLYLQARMHQTGELKTAETLTRSHMLQMLEEKIHSIDWESAKADIRSFIIEPKQIEIWSPQYFLDLIQHLIIEDHR